MNISRMKLQDLLDLSYEDDLKNLTKKQFLALEKRLHKAATRRLEVIKKHGMSSEAFTRYVGLEMPKLSTQEDSRQSVQHKVAMLSNFLNAKTSSYSSLKKVYQEQERRIFGENWKEIGFKNEEQRTRFWAAYSEFRHQNPALVLGADTSNKVMQYIAQESFWRTSDFTAEDLDRIAKNILGIGGVDYRARTGREIPEFDL